MKKPFTKTVLFILIYTMLLGLFSACGTEQSVYYSSTEELANKRISIWQGFTYEDFIRPVYPAAEYFYFGDVNLMYEV